MSQLALPVEVTPAQIALEKTLGAAIELCAKAAGLEGKQIQDALHTDKSQWSRWVSGGEGIVWPKFAALMDACGNDALLLWMIHVRGYDLHSLHKLESETEKRLRVVEEENRALRRVLMGVAV